ncbi:MAG: response regulator [Nitrospirales bacterium]|nr:response regulator [Nitrospirales bacterium]
MRWPCATEYDLILMDVQMPEMDGFTATRLLREQGFQTPIVGLTANAMKGFEQELFEAGYSDYLTKPINIDGFVSKLAQLLHAQQGIEGSPESLMPGTSQDQTSEAEDTSPIVSMLGTNNPKFEKVIARFVSRLNNQLQAMEEAYSNRDMETLAKLAHWLKGAGGTVGFDVFNQPAAELEDAAKAAALTAIGEKLQQIKRLTIRISLDDSLIPSDNLAASTSSQSTG